MDLFYDDLNFGSEALSDTTDHVSLVGGPEARGRYNLNTDAVERFLDDLALLDVRLADEDAVEANHLASVGADHHVFHSSDHLFEHRHGATARAGF